MTAPILPPVTLFGAFEKVATQPDGTLLVDFTVTSEAVDDQGEIVDYDAVKKAAADYMTWAAMREMHQPSAVGTTLSLQADDAGRRITGQGHVVDPTAILKVQTGVYKGVSMGGRRLDTQMEKVGGKSVRRVTKLAWTELSLVDRPSNPDSFLTLAKCSEAEETPMADDPVTPAATAPEAGTDLYLGPDGKPLAKVAESPSGEAPADILREMSEPLAKSAADDIESVGYCIGCVARLIERESVEGEADQVGALKEALAALQRFAGLEAAELGTPEDTASAIVEAVESAMAYSSKTGDLGKAAPDLRETITAIVDEVLAKRSATSPEPVEIATIEHIGQEVPLAEALLQKTTSYLDEQFARYVSRPDLDAMKAEVLGALAPLKEDLAKIARMPAPGGPLRFAVDGDRFADQEAGPSTEAEVLSKAARATSDPHMREELGRLAAAAQIAAGRRAQL